MSKQLEAFRAGVAAANWTDHTFDAWLETHERVHVRTVQRMLGVEQDGRPGPKTVQALENKLAGSLVPTPAADFGLRIKTPPMSATYGLSPCRQSTMLDIFGPPGALTENCSPVTSERVNALCRTHQVHSAFRVTGLKPAVDALVRVFDEVRRLMPDLYAVLGTAGMLCCRKVRGGSGYSNHSWGTAIDITIGGKLDGLGDGWSQQGLLELSRPMRNEGFFWGAYFGREDSMHFEASDDLVREWRTKGTA